MDKTIKYIFVDLDGTLIKTDLLFETALTYLKINPLNIFRLFLWIFRGKSILKHNLAQRIDINAKSLPYNTPLIDYLILKKTQGHTLILATASHMRYAQNIADYLCFFDDVIATDANNNLKGYRKLSAIQKYANGNSFSYAGDSKADVPIWENSTSNIFVNAPKSAINDARAAGKIDKIFTTYKQPKIASFLKGMRLHQWAKNTLIFVPLLTSHNYINADLTLNSFLAFICFSLCASGVYFLNDLLDLDADRQHLTKNKRPLASGELSIPLGIIGAGMLPAISFLIAWVLLPINFFIVLIIYFSITNAYSFFLKRISTADVMTLAVLYTTRIIAGSTATGIILSSWLMAFSIFVFVSLAYLKRYIEISALERSDANIKGRGYSTTDSETMFSLGTSNITASVLVLALYINSDEVVDLYTAPQILWVLCMLMLYWGNRIWVGARRGKITDDPVLFAIKDPISRVIGIGFIVVVLAARYFEI